jgi:hypothetical protein
VVRPALEVADIFRDHGPAWRRANQGHLSCAQIKVMSAIEGCRTAALGGHVARCENDDCGYTAIAYNSCRNRHCPKCQGSQALAWMEARKAELLQVPYFHVVFTLPPRIGAIAYQNKAVIYDLLFKASAETLLTIAADPKRLGVRIGFTSVLHTWGSAMTHHPHVHMIVPGGGISLDGSRWISSSEDYLLPVPVLSLLLRGKMLAMLKAAHQAGRLQFFGPHAELVDRRAFKAWLEPLYDTNWHVYAKRPFAGPEQVLAYLARYTHRVAISNSRLISVEQNGVTFKYKDYRIDGPDRYKTMTLAVPELHPPLHAARAAQGLPSHPPLRAARQRPRQVSDHRAGARAHHCSGSAGAGQRSARLRPRSGIIRRQASTSLPMLRRAHGHHRDVRGGMHAAASADSVADRHQDRHLMMPVAPISHATSDRLCRWLRAGDEAARPERPSAALLEPRPSASTAATTPIWAVTCPLPLARRRARRIARRSLHHICQPNPHSAT